MLRNGLFLESIQQFDTNSNRELEPTRKAVARRSRHSAGLLLLNESLQDYKHADRKLEWQ